MTPQIQANRMGADTMTEHTDHYDALETRAPAMREAELFSRLPDVLRKAMAAPAYAERFRGIDPAGVTSRAALARLPVLRKAELPALHKASPPFGGFVTDPPGSFGRLFTSPGPIFEPEAVHADPWRGARALFAAGFRPGDVNSRPNDPAGPVTNPPNGGAALCSAGNSDLRKTGRRASAARLVMAAGSMPVRGSA